MTARMLVVALLAFDLPELSLKLVNGHVNTPIRILTFFGANENLTVLGLGDNFHARITALVAVYYHFDSIDAVIILWKFGGFLLGVRSDRFGYFDMFAADCKKQVFSP
jgi:hypothetical protein